jgi:phage-related protein
MKPFFWIGSSRKDIQAFPEEVKDEIGHALQEAQFGLKPLSAKPLRGYGGATVLEVVADFRTDTYRAVYTVRFEGVVYVLHVFQKKSKRGIATPRADLEIINQRLRAAEAHYQDWQRSQQKGA